MKEESWTTYLVIETDQQSYKREWCLDRAAVLHAQLQLPLFTSMQRRTAIDRLRQYGYTGPLPDIDSV